MKITRVVMAIVAVCALSAFASSSAFAFEAAKFLINGAEVGAGGAPVEATGELLFENLLNGAAFVCAGKFIGKVEAGGKGSITEVLNSAGELVGELGGKSISCTSEKTCSKAIAFVDEIPFSIKAEEEAGKFFVLIKGAYEFECEVIGIKISELCHAVTEEGFIGGEVTNLATDFEANEATAPKSECNTNAEEGTVTNVKGNLTSSTSGNLAVSLP